MSTEETVPSEQFENEPLAETNLDESQEEEQEISFNPLEHPWTLWYDHQPVQEVSLHSKKEQGKIWTASLAKIFTMNTVEEFWSVFNNIQVPTALEPNSDYHLFKDGIRPEWEDPKNERGGKWVCSFKKTQANARLCEDYWTFVTLACIGEMFKHGDIVTGCVFSVRKQNWRISLWISTKEEGDALAIGQEFKDQMGLPEEFKLEFLPHSDAMNTRKRKNDRHKPKLQV